MANTTSGKSSSRPEKMTKAERDAFLIAPNVTRFSTIRPDGWAHTTPIYYAWENDRFLHSLGPGRRHLTNLASNSKVTECVDLDWRPTTGASSGAISVLCFGEATIIEDAATVAEVTQRILVKYLGEADGNGYFNHIQSEFGNGRVLVSVEPVTWLTWDYRKS